MKTIIHVNQHIIKSNRRDGTNNPPLTVKTYKGNTKCHEAVIFGPSTIVYRQENPLDCGAHIWIETKERVDTLVYN
jgi:hypothetical protein